MDFDGCVCTHPGNHQHSRDTRHFHRSPGGGWICALGDLRVDGKLSGPCPQRTGPLPAPRLPPASRSAGGNAGAFGQQSAGLVTQHVVPDQQHRRPQEMPEMLNLGPYLRATRDLHFNQISEWSECT